MAKTSKVKHPKVIIESLLMQTQQYLLLVSKEGQWSFARIYSRLLDHFIKVLKDLIDSFHYLRHTVWQLRNVLKNLAVLEMGLFLQACVPFGLYQNAYNVGVDYLNPMPFTLTNTIMNSPYAMQLVRYKNSHSVMVLAYVDDGSKLSWVDSEGNGFTTLDGKIIASNGLDNDIEIMNPPKVRDIFLVLLGGNTEKIAHNSLFRLSAPPTGYLEMQHSFKIFKSKQESMKRQIDQTEVYVRLIEERIYVPAIRWETYNYYWVDDRGSVLKSKQTLAPNMKKYFLETLKDFKPVN